MAVEQVWRVNFDVEITGNENNEPLGISLSGPKQRPTRVDIESRAQDPNNSSQGAQTPHGSDEV
ncbi:hypothetical protein QJS04_geneDACA011933 [Acorus gramineus]|uniref:Uncharacterized protein n=1 Tax=Acorus gramineus TaxID=55184 RepID=A0AAV9AHS4_ACOGR|nr:hypothetical protein QJS04_geneDACA011933 [Acorus gramineus]